MGLTKIDDRGLKTPIDLLDNEKIRLGTGNDLELYHNGTNSEINHVTSGTLQITANSLKLMNYSGPESYIVCTSNGSVDLYYNNSKKLETTSIGNQVTGQLVIPDGGNNSGDNNVTFGSDNDCHMYHTGSHLFLVNNTGSIDIRAKAGEKSIVADPDGAVELYHDNSKRLETTSVGVKLLGSGTDAIEMTGDVWFNNNEHAGKDIYFNSGDKHLIFEDEVKAKFGSAGDLEIYHDASHSYIYDTGTGKLRLVTNSFRLLETDNSSNMIAADENGAVELYYDGGKKLETHAHGIRLNGAETGAQFQLGAGNDFQIEHDGSNTYLYNLTNDLVIQNDAAVEITAKSGGTKRFRFDSDGLKFGSDTAAANALSDYEEGTWTPVMKKYNSSNNTWVNATMADNGTVQIAKYVKVGRICTIYLHWDGWQQSDANYAVIGGLPFASMGSGGGHGTVSYTDAFTSNQNQGIYISTNTTLMQFYHSSNAWNGWSSSSNRNIHLGLTYQTA